MKKWKDAILNPDEDNSTELGEVPHEEEKGSIMQHNLVCTISIWKVHLLMKLIMENWRRFLTESPLYDYEPEKFGPLSLYHEDNGDNGELVLYHMMPSIVDNGMYIVGYISYDETQEPCIPKTYQVGGVYV